MKPLIQTLIGSDIYLVSVQGEGARDSKIVPGKKVLKTLMGFMHYGTHEEALEENSEIVKEIFDDDYWCVYNNVCETYHHDFYCGSIDIFLVKDTSIIDTFKPFTFWD